MTTDRPLPPYTIAVFKPNPETQPHHELIAIKRVTGHWDLVGTEAYWFDTDEELFEEWPEVEIRGIGIWPDENA